MWKYMDYEYGLRLHYTEFGLENTWISNLDFDGYLWIWTWKYLDYEFGLRLLDFNWVWTWKYLDWDIDYDWFNIPLKKYEDFLDLSIKDLTNYLLVRGLNTSSRKVELVAMAYLI